MSAPTPDYDAARALVHGDAPYDEIMQDKIDAACAPLVARIETLERAVRVRIAVAVDPQGNWAAAGWMADKDQESSMAATAVEQVDEGEHIVWVEADVPLPVVRSVEGKVSQ